MTHEQLQEALLTVRYLLDGRRRTNRFPPTQEAFRRFLEAESKPKRILIACKGNICRSPYAEAKLRQLLTRASLNQINVHSCGILTTPGKSCHPLALKIASERGIDLTHHQTMSVSAIDLSGIDLILLMDPRHEEALTGGNNRVKEKSALLASFALARLRNVVIADPYRDESVPTNDDIFRQCFDKIDLALERLVKLIAEGNAR